MQQPTLEISCLFTIAIVGDSGQCQIFPGWTGTGDPAFVELEVVLAEVAGGFLGFTFLLTFAVLLLLGFELAVATAELVVAPLKPCFCRRAENDRAMQVQRDLGSDIVMIFDECTAQQDRGIWHQRRRS